ncbi:MAG: hypothetical protein LUE10_07305 [Alistipes sp.]|nr:hypothetical protein [Alistipes sp.]
MKYPLHTLMAILLAISVIGCKSPNSHPLVLETQTSKIAAGENVKIQILKGNGNYTISCGNEDILMVGFSRTGKTPGELLLTGLCAGRTWVSLTDNVTGHKAELRVDVTGPGEPEP